MESISVLVERFLSAQKEGGISYFDVDEIVSLINHFLEIDDVENLKIIIEMGYDLHPEDVHFKIALCRTLVAMDDFESALKLIEELKIQDNKEVDLIRIECYCELEQYDEFIELIHVLTEKHVSYLEDAVIHGACVLNDIPQYWDNAYTFIQYALNLFPDNIELKSELCYNYELQGKTKEAFSLCKELINKAPFAAEIWYMQGRLYSMCADFVNAVDSFDFAVTCIDDNLDLEYEIKLMRAYCLYKNESYDEAIADYRDLVRYDAYTRLQVDPFLAECYIRINEYEAAYELLKEVIREPDLDDEVSVYGNFIYCCIETDRKKEAIDLLGDALKRFPHSILEYIATLNIQKGQQPESFTGKEKPVYPDELARKYFNNNYHNN